MNEDRRFDELISRLPPELAARQKARRAAAQAEIAALKEKTNNMFQMTDSVVGAYRTQGGLLDSQTVFSLRKWQNPNGDIVFENSREPIVGEKETDLRQVALLALSSKIKTEKTHFDSLSPSEKARAKQEGNPQFGAYLSNEALGQQFAGLKTGR